MPIVNLTLFAAQVTNMNSGGYLFQNPNPKSSKQYDTDYGTRYPGSQREYFEVYAGPISTRYGEVFWRGLPSVPLPEDIVRRFDNRTIAITGYEQDQVIKGENGTADQSVPIYWAYNHHYVAWLKGKHATMVELDGTDHGVTGHPLLMNAVAIDDPDPDSVIPTSQFFSEGNGGESRKSYHGYPQYKSQGNAQLLASPTEFVITPMQIDTWNRDKKYGEPFAPGPESTASEAPMEGPDAIYSGHLECPCTDRIIKTIKHTYATQSTATCPTAVEKAEDCYASAAEVGIAASKISRNQTVDSPTLPAGCSVLNNGKSYTVSFNTHASTAKCGASTGKPRVQGSMKSLTQFAVDLDGSSDVATLTMTGPATVWFGVGLGAQVMKDAPNAIIVSGNGTVFEQKLGDQQAGKGLPLSVKVTSNTVANGLRTVVMTRPLKGLTSDHFTFSLTEPSIKYINAIGRGATFAYHKSRAASVVSLTAVDAHTCICNTGTHGFISSDMNPNPAPFSKNCQPEPAGDLAEDHNPTCTIEQYAGGLKCCTSGNILLDKDQNPWPDNKLTYYMKWRFYFQDYTPETKATADVPAKPASHQNLVRFFKETEADAGEYDVVKAPAGTKPEDAVYQITAHFQTHEGVAPCNPRTSPHCAGPEVMSSGINLVYASCHCHAPSCISCELWNADTGKLICRQVPVYGKSPAATRENPFDEKGYVAIPPCLYGEEEDGLMPPPYMAYNQNLTSIKRNNNTYGHYGEMAMWQMRGFQSYEPAADSL